MLAMMVLLYRSGLQCLPESSSLAVVVYEYATSSFAVTAVLVIDGASFAPVMVIVTVIVSE